LGFALLTQSWVPSLGSSFPPLLGDLFNGACQGFITKQLIGTGYDEEIDFFLSCCKFRPVSSFILSGTGLFTLKTFSMEVNLFFSLVQNVYHGQKLVSFNLSPQDEVCYRHNLCLELFFLQLA
jgi:hypothetical protein